MRYLSGSQHHLPDLHSKANLRESLGYGKSLIACFVDLEKHKTELLAIKFRRFCRSLWRCWLVITSHLVILLPTGGWLVFGQMASNRSRSMSALDSGKSAFLSPLFFIVYMNWIDKCSQVDECATIGNCKISRMQFLDDLVCFLRRNMASSAH